MTIVDVYLNGHDDVAEALRPGKAPASGIFEKIGVHLKWHTGERPAGRISLADLAIYEDRILPFPAEFRIPRDVAAGYVLAHELAHVIEGVNRHSESGILKAQWSRQDYADMALGKLAFTPRDVELIRLGLTDRVRGRGPERTAAPAPVATVCVDQVADGSPILIAQAEAFHLFSAIPVRIAWKSGRPCQASDAIHVRVTSRTPEALMPGVMAFARHEGSSIEIFYDRVRARVGPWNTSHLVAYHLAYVLAHEIAHILEDQAQHSETGIMKAYWSEDDYQAMWTGALAFAPEDVRLIQLGLEARAERRAVLSHTSEFR
jgi:hypothetical protein